MQIEVKGLASGRSLFFEISEAELNENLLTWLRKNKVTIASSCDGEGVCKKCVIQNDWLTCKMTVKEFLKLSPVGKILVAYL